MIPRLKTSKKSTPFPQEFVDQIKSAFIENFKEQLTNAELIIQGRIYPQEILLRVGFLEKGHLRQSNFEVSAAYDYKKQNAIESIHLCIDFLASTLGQYFEQLSQKANPSEEAEESEPLDLPYLWKPIQFEKQEVFFQYSTVNTKLEEEADRLLGVSSEELVKDEEEEDFEPTDLEEDESSNEEPEDSDPSKRTIH